MPILLLRLVVGAGLVTLAYYVGREVGRLESTRRDLEARKPVATAEPRADRGESERTPAQPPGASRAP